MRNNLMWICAIIVLLCSCGNAPENQSASGDGSQPVKTSIVPKDLPGFNADSAYSYTDKQVKFGPRVPNTPAHVACGDYLISELKRQGATVIVQAGTVTAYTGESLKFRNIVGKINPEIKDRIMLSCHWDTRPFSDQDKNKPRDRFDGAVDGAASAGILLEMARLMKNKPAAIGVDIVFYDAEDFGDPGSGGNTFCLGSQYFASQPPEKGYTARFGINLDMVAGAGATFYKEGFSVKYAPDIVGRVWQIASELGYDRYFVNEISGDVTDDHLYINQIMGIPTIDIIAHDPRTGFPEFWHTQEDNMSAVDKTTMGVVGHVLLAVIYSEKPAV